MTKSRARRSVRHERDRPLVSRTSISPPELGLARGGLLASKWRRVADTAAAQLDPAEVVEQGDQAARGQTAAYQAEAVVAPILVTARGCHHASRGLPPGLCCHPYDICTALIAEELGVVLTDAAGAPLDAPFDLQTDVSWIGYANDRLRARLEPLLQQALRRRGLMPNASTRPPRSHAASPSC